MKSFALAFFALARRGSFPAILSGALASVAVALTLLVLKSYEIITLDQFYIYPITCLVFAAVALAIKPNFQSTISK